MVDTEDANKSLKKLIYVVNLLSKPKRPQKVRPHLYSTERGDAHLPGGRERGSLKSAKTSKTSKPLKQSRQNSRHFKAVDSELMGCKTSKHVS